MLNWDAETLWQTLAPSEPGFSIEIVPECCSTNSVLLERSRRLGAGQPPALLVAERQSAGRGRLGRQWWSDAPGSALTFSLALALTPRDWSGLSIAVGLAVAEALDAAGALIGLKWPNDLWLRHEDRKLGGILIETSPLPDARTPETRLAVIGIGLNIAAEPPSGGSYATGYVGLQTLDPRWDAPAVLQRVVPVLLRRVRQFEAAGLAPLQPAYTTRDVLAGRNVRAGEQTGRAEGIDTHGNLQLRTDAGPVAIASGEVSVRPC